MFEFFLIAGLNLGLLDANVVEVGASLPISQQIAVEGRVGASTEHTFTTVGFRTLGNEANVFVGMNFHERFYGLDTNYSFVISGEVCAQNVCMGLEHQSNGHGNIFKHRRNNIPFDFLFVRMRW